MPTVTKARIKAIDQFRGFAIILMVVMNYGMEIQTLPDWLKHVPDVGMNFADLGTPVFVFTIGLTYGLSFHHRVAEGGLATTIGHFLRRYLAFIGLGAIITAGGVMIGHHPSTAAWGVLQAIGGAGLVTLLFILLPTGARLLAGLGLLACYQILLDRFWMETVLNAQHGGFAGTLSWAAILIIATVFGDIYHNEKHRKYFPGMSVLFIIVGFVLGFIVPISKNQVSASYDLITLGSSGIGFAIFYLTNFELSFFIAWGQNPILLYCLAFLLTGLFVLPGIPFWHAQAPLWLIGLQALTLLLILSAVALYWQRKGFIFSM